MAKPMAPPFQLGLFRMSPPLKVIRFVESSTAGVNGPLFRPAPERGTRLKICASVGGVLLFGSTLYQPKSIWQPPPCRTSVPVKLQRGENVTGLVRASD